MIYSENFFKAQREYLVSKLKKRGIKSESVLNAIGTIQREHFIDQAFINRAYEDSALPIDNEQTISQPFTVAFMTELLNVQPNDKILEIGTGSGYQACVLACLGAKVFSIERVQHLYKQASKLISKLGYSVVLKYGDGTLGWKDYAPYKGIIVTAGAPFVPESLKEQLAIGGRIVIPVGDRASQKLTIIDRMSDTLYKTSEYDGFKFVPLIGKQGWQD